MVEESWLLEALFDPAPVAVAVFDRNLHLRRCNPTWANIIPWPGGKSKATDILGQSLDDLIPKGSVGLQSLLARALSGEPVCDEVIQVTEKPTRRYWRLSVQPHLVGGQVIEVGLLAVDISHQMRARQDAERGVADRTRKLTALYEIMTVASEPLDLATMLTRILERVLVAVRSQAGAIYLLNQVGDTLNIVAQEGLTPELAKLLDSSPVANGLAGAVAHGRQPVVVADVHSDPRTRDALRRSHWRAYAGLPLVVNDRLLGVISVLRHTNRPFKGTDVALLNSVADQIGVAVENRRLDQQAQELAVLEERSRLARELHDAVSQAIFSISLLAGAGLRLLESNAELQPEQLRELLSETLRDMHQSAQQALKEMRLLLYRLGPAALQRDNLVGALRRRLEAVEKRAGVNAQLEIEYFEPLAPEIEEACFLIGQEALNNALRHAAATKVSVRLQRRNDQLALSIKDNGRGFERQQAEGGMGLANMRQRAESLGGQLTVESAPGQGTVIEALLPLTEQSHE